MKSYKKYHHKSAHLIKRPKNQGENYPRYYLKKAEQNLHTYKILSFKANHKPLEIITLTQIPSKIPEFFRRKLNHTETKIEEIEPVTNQKIVKTLDNADEVKVVQPNICEHPNCENPKFSNKHCSVHTNSYVKKPSDEEKDTSISDFEEKKLEQETYRHDVILDDNNWKMMMIMIRRTMMICQRLSVI